VPVLAFSYCPFSVSVVTTYVDTIVFSRYFFKTVNDLNSNIFERAEFFHAVLKAQLDGVGGRILLGDNTGGVESAEDDQPLGAGSFF